MTNGHDAELQAWMADWHAGAESAPSDPGDPIAARAVSDLRRQVRRRTWRMVATTAGETAVGLAWLVVAVYGAWRRPHPVDRLLLATFAVMIVWLLWFSLRNRRGTWRAVTETTMAYLALAILRVERRLRSLRVGWGILAFEVILLAAWIWWRSPEAPPAPGFYLWAYLFLAGWSGLAAVIVAWMSARAGRERDELIALRGALARADDADGSGGGEASRTSGSAIASTFVGGRGGSGRWRRRPRPHGRVR